MKLIRLCVRRPVGTVMFFVGILLLGYVSLRNLTIDLLPSISYPKLTVITEYPGATSEEVEKMITDPLEASLSSIPSLKKIDSISREGLSIISLQFHWGTNMDFALLHTKERVESASERLPEDCGKPSIIQWDPSSRPIIIAVLSGGSVGQLRDTAQYLIKPRLERLKGIARVEVRGGSQEQIIVSLNPEKMARYGVNFQDIKTAINSYNQLSIGGTVKKNKIRFIVKVEGEIKTPSQISEIPVKKTTGRLILIKDLGQADFGKKPLQGDIRFNGKRAVALMIYKESGANTVEATLKVKKEIKRIEQEFSGIKFNIVSEDAELITSSINSIKYSIYIGAFLAFLVLLLFLKNLRDPLLVALVIPISVISTFVLMFFAKVNINIMSLGGLALGVGMFVDNSIVVLESMFRHRRDKSPENAAVEGASEVAGAITASTFTTIVIFLPVIYIYGITGRLFRDLALTVSFSLFSSLVVSLTLLPSLFAVFSREHEKRKVAPEGKKGKRKPLEWVHFILAIPFQAFIYALSYILKAFIYSLKKILLLIGRLFQLIFTPVFEGFEHFYGKFDRWYHGFLRVCFDRKSIPMGITAFMLLFILASYPFIKKELLPSPATARYEIEARTTSDYGFDSTDKISNKIEKLLLKLNNTSFVFSQTGAVSRFSGAEESLSVNNIEMLVGAKDRLKGMSEARAILSKFPGLSFSVFPERNTLTRYLRLGAENFQMKVFYQNPEDGKKTVLNILNKIKNISGLTDFKTNAFYEKPILSVRFNDEILKKTGLSRKELADTIEAAFRGERVAIIKRFQKSYDVIVTTPYREKRNLDNLLSLPVSVKGRTFRISELVNLNPISSLGEVTHENQERYFLISADLRGNLAEISREASKLIAGLEFPPGVRISIGGAEEERQKAFRSINAALLLAVILVYMVMAAQFENLIHPLIIMITIPMGLFGGFLLLLATGASINVISGIGFMVMAGIVVNDAIVKVDYANKLRRRGLSPKEAMMEASIVRLRPILMTTFTTVFGLFPMALMHMTGSELQRPLAIVVIGGLIASTFLTLILIPVLYVMISRE